MNRKLLTLISYLLTLAGTVLLGISFWKTGQPWAPAIICWLVGIVFLIARPGEGNGQEENQPEDAIH